MATEFDADIAAVQRIAAVPRILEVVCRSTGMGFAAVARVTENRWVCCAVRDEIAFGLAPGGELEVETTICHEIRQSGEAVVIDEVAQDTAFYGHHTPAKYGFQSYISMPITLADGTFFGTLCAIDPRPARLNTPQTIGMFKLFAELIAIHLDAVDRLAATEAKLLNERQTAELREQFIAVLGHDLRNPLASIAAGTKMLPKAKSKEAAGEILGLMQKSAARMSAMIDNVLDFARGRLGSGIALKRAPEPLQPVLKQVIAELHAIYPDRKVDAKFAMGDAVDCDSGRIAQLFSNLLGNAGRDAVHVPDAGQLIAGGNLDFGARDPLDSLRTKEEHIPRRRKIYSTSKREDFAMSEAAPQTPNDHYEQACDQAIIMCGGNMRGAIKALIMANEYLETELQELLAKLSTGYERRADDDAA